MKIKQINRKSCCRFGYIPPERQQVFWKSTSILTFFSDLYFRFFGLPDITQRIRFHYVSKLLDVNPKSLSMDVGCGYGLYLTWLASRGIQVVGVDVASDKIEFAHKTIKTLGIQDRASCVLASACNLPFRDDCFETCLSLDVIEHIPNDQDAFSEMSRVLRPKGVVVLTTPCVPQRFHFKSLNTLHGQWGHVREGYSFEQLETIIEDRCMEIVSHFSWLKFFTSKVFDLHFRFFWEQRSKFRLLVCALLFPLMYMVSFLDSIFFGQTQGNEFALKAVKLGSS